MLSSSIRFFKALYAFRPCMKQLRCILAVLYCFLLLARFQCLRLHPFSHCCTHSQHSQIKSASCPQIAEEVEAQTPKKSADAEGLQTLLDPDSERSQKEQLQMEMKVLSPLRFNNLA